MRRPSVRRRTEDLLIGGAGGMLLTTLLSSTRSEMVAGTEVESEIMLRGLPAVYVLWHGRLLSCAFHFRKRRLATLISQNRDGDHITAVVESWGYRVIRGSSSRGGTAALRDIVRVLREGTSVAVTPDGPRGPRQKMKIGPLLAAQLAGVPIVPAAASAARGAFFGRWDRFLVPAPFTWVPVAFGEPLHVERSATALEVEGKARELEERLNGLTALVDEAARAGR